MTVIHMQGLYTALVLQQQSSKQAVPLFGLCFLSFCSCTSHLILTVMPAAHKTVPMIIWTACGDCWSQYTCCMPCMQAQCSFIYASGSGITHSCHWRGWTSPWKPRLSWRCICWMTAACNHSKQVLDRLSGPS